MIIAGKPGKFYYAALKFEGCMGHKEIKLRSPKRNVSPLSVSLEAFPTRVAIEAPLAFSQEELKFMPRNSIVSPQITG